MLTTDHPAPPLHFIFSEHVLDARRLCRPRAWRNAPTRTDLGGKAFVDFVERCTMCIAVIPHKIDDLSSFAHQSGKRLHPIAMNDDRGLDTGDMYKPDSASTHILVTIAARSGHFTSGSEGHGFFEPI